MLLISDVQNIHMHIVIVNHEHYPHVIDMSTVLSIIYHRGVGIRHQIRNITTFL